jgi:hypothetical protein
MFTCTAGLLLWCFSVTLIAKDTHGTSGAMLARQCTSHMLRRFARDLEAFFTELEQLNTNVVLSR